MNGAARATLTLSTGLAPCALQHLTPLLRIDLGRIRRLDEIEQHVEEALGLVEVGEVAGLLEELEAAGGHQLMRRHAVLYRDDGVALAPDEEKRDVLGQIEAVCG